MPEKNFTEFSLEIQRHFENETHAEGLALANEHAGQFPDKAPLLNYWRMCLAARLKDDEQANHILEATLSTGIWYSEMLLRQSPSLESLQGTGDFERLVEAALALRDADPSDTIPMLIVRPEDRCTQGQTPCPALVFIHGNTDNAQANLIHWQSVANQGWVVSLPQSQYAMWAGAYAWTDHETAAEEIETSYEKLVKQYALDSRRIVLAGFSMGAEVALWLALTGRIPAQGFLLLGPGGPFMSKIEEWEPLILQAQGRGLRGAILTGLDDTTIPHDNVRLLVQNLNSGGIPCQHHEYPKLGHEYPPDFETDALSALNFILKS
ncbi:MAG: alpha/beta hydrolase [Anaerolineae bacterium]|nr:alpha/beta hydrolase [Anaerolineae bacterium]